MVLCWYEQCQGFQILLQSTLVMLWAGPGLLHFRDSNLPKIGRKAKDAWNDIIKDKTPLPTPSIKIYDVYGNYEGTRTFKPTEHQHHTRHHSIRFFPPPCPKVLTRSRCACQLDSRALMKLFSTSVPRVVLKRLISLALQWRICVLSCLYANKNCG